MVQLGPIDANDAEYEAEYKSFYLHSLAGLTDVVTIATLEYLGGRRHQIKAHLVKHKMQKPGIEKFKILLNREIQNPVKQRNAKTLQQRNAKGKC